MTNNSANNSRFSYIDWEEIDKLRKAYKFEYRAESTGSWTAIDIAGRPVAPVYVNGKGPFKVIIDSAAVACYLSDRIKDELEIKQFSQQMMLLDTLSIGSVCWQDAQISYGSTDRESELCGLRVDGLFGSLFWILQSVTPIIDYPAKQILLEPGDGKNQESLRAYMTDWIPMEIYSFTPFVQVTINEAGPFRFSVDTGSSSCFLTEAVAKRLCLTLGREGIARGRLKDHTFRESSLSSISLGKTEVLDLPINVQSDPFLIKENTQVVVDGIIGTSFFKQFQVTLDYCSERFGLRRTSDPAINTTIRS